MKLAFFYSNKGLGTVDCSHPDDGNPGIGGTQYCLLLLLEYLYLYRPEWDLTVFVLEKTKLPSGIKQIEVDTMSEALSLAEQQSTDFFVAPHKIEDHVFNLIDTLNIKVITWGQNYYLAPLARSISNTSNIVANIFVGKQQYDRYIDHPVISKSVKIFNMVNRLEETERTNDSSTVVYLGSLVPSKGFHLLAKMWKDILKEVPNAKLKVIGTGKVYNRNAKLGLLGIAEESYEKIFRPYLLNNNGELLDSVEFLGLLGAEKKDILLNASVGVVNPSARTETFGISAVEMAMFGLPVVTLRANGFLDTVASGKTGFLGKNQSDNKRKIILLLKNEKLNSELGNNSKIFAEGFTAGNIVKEWVSLFESLHKNEIIPYQKAARPYSANFKWIRMVNRFFRNKLRLKILPPFINVETFIYNLIRK